MAIISERLLFTKIQTQAELARSSEPSLTDMEGKVSKVDRLIL
jgi:hypothetical protein